MDKWTRLRVVDVETSGLTDDKEVLELGICEVHAKGKEVIIQPPAFFLFRNTRPIPPQASAVHHLTAGDLAHMLPWAESSQGAWNWGREAAGPIHYLVAHNTDFEEPLLSSLEPTAAWICTYKCALRAWPDAPAHGNQVLRYWLTEEGRWPVTARAFSRKQAEPTHRAGPDAYVTAYLLAALLAEHPIEVLAQWSRELRHVARIPFGNLKGKPWSEADQGLLYWTIDAARDFDEGVKAAARRELDRRAQERDDQEAAARIERDRQGQMIFDNPRGRPVS